MEDNKFIKGIGIWYRNEINSIKKKESTSLQPIFEAFTNALESIAIFKHNYGSSEKGKISIKLYLTRNLLSDESNEYFFQKIIIEDSGIGFTENEFERFINLRDDRKNLSNKGTGRVQFLHYFDKTKIISIYKDINSLTGFKKRIFTLSKSEVFLSNNAIICLDSETEETAENPFTVLIFENPLNKKDDDFYCTLTANEIKIQLIRHYLAYFCENRTNLPEIKIKTIIDDIDNTELEIISSDIPIADKEEPIEIYYSRVNNNNIEKTSNKTIFNLKTFIIPQDKLLQNGLKLVSKGEIAKDIELDNLLPTDHINGNRYLFLLSSNYIDERDSDTRGEINIFKRKDFKKRNCDSIISEEEILLEDIEENTNNKIISLYKEIEEKSKEKEKSIEELQKMFLLNPKTLKSLHNKINIGDSDDSILRKVYEADSKIVADKDAEIKKQKKDLENLDTTKPDYQKILNEKVNEFVKIIPIQNRTALTQYVARRKLVLELFDMIIKKEIEKLNNGGRIDEDLMHNLIFQQSSKNPESSDLWLINEEYIYFKGVSEGILGQIMLDGKKIIKEKLTPDELEYRTKQGGDARLKRTDILLFPNEAKCIIIELKAPEENISKHLNQINRYASLINNLSIDTLKFNTFYGYLIGESIDADDIIDNDSDFINAPNLGYIFRPYKRIVGKFGRSDGALYTEILKYTTLLKRANLRNKIFIDKLTKQIPNT